MINNIPPKKRIAIIGATSPIGKHIASSLISDYDLNLTYRNKNLLPKTFRNQAHIDCHYYDFECQDQPDIQMIKDCHIIIWTVHISHLTEKKQIEMNYNAMQSFLSILKQANVQKIIYMSSGGSIYGIPSIVPVSETHPLHPVSPYGKAKKAVETLLDDFCSRTDIDYVILRPGNIYGPDSITGRSKGIIASYLNSALNNEPFSIMGDPSNIRDYLHINDLIQAVIYSIQSKNKRVVWNVGSGIGYSVSYVMNLITKLIGMSPSTIDQKQLKNEIKVNILANNRIKNESDWRLSTSLQDGIEMLKKHI